MRPRISLVKHPHYLVAAIRHMQDHRGLTIALLALLSTAILVSPAGTPAAQAAPPAMLRGTAGPLQPPMAALAANGIRGTGERALGLAALRRGLIPHVAADAAPNTVSASLPATIDLSADSPPVAYQGSVASCVSWVTGYYLRGWYARRDGYYPSGGPDGNGGFAPMYLFSQITNGQDTGTTFDANLTMMQSQGIDSRDDYAQGDTNYTDQPTTPQHTRAAQYKIASYNTLFLGANQGPSAQQEIESSLAAGNPVSLGLPVYDNFWNADNTHYYIDVSNLGPTNHGNHAVFASKYDANGLWVENQWGTDWGLNGWVELSWAFVDKYVWQAVTLQPLSAAPVASSTPTAVPTSTATKTATPAPPTATNTATPVLPTATSTATSAVTAVTGTATSVAPMPTNTKTSSTPTAVTNVPATPTTTRIVPVPSGTPTATATAIVHRPAAHISATRTRPHVVQSTHAHSTSPRQTQQHRGQSHHRGIGPHVRASVVAHRTVTQHRSPARVATKLPEHRSVAGANTKLLQHHSTIRATSRAPRHRSTVRATSKAARHHVKTRATSSRPRHRATTHATTHRLPHKAGMKSQ